MGINFTELGDEMNDKITYEDWAALNRLRARGIAVVLFMPCEMDGLDVNEVQVAAIRGAYEFVGRYGQAAQARDTAVRALADFKNIK